MRSLLSLFSSASPGITCPGGCIMRRRARVPVTLAIIPLVSRVASAQEMTRIFSSRPSRVMVSTTFAPSRVTARAQGFETVGTAGVNAQSGHTIYLGEPWHVIWEGSGEYNLYRWLYRASPRARTRHAFDHFPCFSSHLCPRDDSNFSSRLSRANQTRTLTRHRASSGF